MANFGETNMTHGIVQRGIHETPVAGIDLKAILLRMIFSVPSSGELLRWMLGGERLVRLQSTPAEIVSTINQMVFEPTANHRPDRIRASTC